MVAVYDIDAGAEQQECAGTIRAFGFALSKALVTDECALLVSNETTKRNALEGPVRQISVHLARRDETRQNRYPYAEKLQKDRIPLQCADVEQKRPRSIAHFTDMLIGIHATEQILSSLSMTGPRGVIKGVMWLETDVCYPRLDRAKCEVVSLVRSADIIPIIDHPSELDRGEVRGKWEASPTPD
jgi:hypothetical protein